MMNRNALIAFVVALLLTPPVGAQEINDISVMQLIVSPGQFHGKLVRVIGFLRLEFEGNAIYLHQDDYNHGISKNGLWIESNDLINDQRNRINNQYVLVEGNFDADNTGHFGMWSGAITNIRRVMPWSDPRNPKGKK